MYGFIPDHDTVRSLLFIGTFYFCVIIAFWRTNIIRIDKPHGPQYFLVFLIVFHLLFAFEGGDYFHYYEAVSKDMLTEGQEPIYHWLARVVGNNYLLWRLVIWGTALFLFMLTAKRFGLDQYKVAYLLYVMYFTLFDYARATLGMAVFLYGVSFWCKPILHRKWLSYIIIAPIIMYTSTFFHSSMYISCASALFMFIPVNKKSIIASIILIPFLASFLLGAFNSLVTNIISNDSSFVAGKVEEYSAQVVEFGGSKFEQVRRYVEYSTLILPIVLMSFQIFKKNFYGPEHIHMLRLYKVALCIVLMSIFILVFSTSIILFNRILYLSMLAITLLFYYCRKRHIISNTSFSIIVILCLLQVFFNYFKRCLGGNIPW